VTAADARVALVPLEGSPAVRDGWSVLSGDRAGVPRAERRQPSLRLVRGAPARLGMGDKPGLNGATSSAAVSAAPAELTGVRGLLLSAAQRERDCRYTLHLDFAADDPAAARLIASVLAHGLGILRPEVETYSAQLSSGERWDDAERVFCMADGPEGAFCAYAKGHPRWHSESGVDGLRWGDGDGARE